MLNLNSSLAAGTVTVELIAWGARSYEQPLVTVPVEFSVGALGSSLVATVPIKSQLANSSLTLMDAVVRLSATACGDPGGRAPSRLLVPCAAIKKCTSQS